MIRLSHRFFAFASFSSLLIVSLFFTSTALAQQSGLSISPATLEETVDPGQSYDHSVTVKNLNDQDQTFYVFTRNISGVGSDGAKPIYEPLNSEKTGLELADWIELSLTEVVIPAQQSVSIGYKITVPENASPGSHFGGIFFSVEPPEIEESGAAVGYQVGNIISLRVAGDANEQASIRQFSTDKYFYGSQNVTFNVKIENMGNVLIKPTGPLEIKNMLGKQVGTIIFNEQLAGVFPYNTREFANIKWSGDSIGLGRYEAIISPVYGESGAKKTMSSTVTFWILPMNIIGPALGVLAVILAIVYFFVRLYIRRSLEQLNYGRRMVRQRKKSGSSTTLFLLVILLSVTALFLLVLLALIA